MLETAPVFANGLSGCQITADGQLCYTVLVTGLCCRRQERWEVALFAYRAGRGLCYGSRGQRHIALFAYGLCHEHGCKSSLAVFANCAGHGGHGRGLQELREFWQAIDLICR